MKNSHYFLYALLITTVHLHAADIDRLNQQLFIALEADDISTDEITELLDRGAQANALNNWTCRTPLHFACRNGRCIYCSGTDRT